MRKPAVFFDFDDLKIDTVPAMIAHVNEHYGIASVRSDYLNGIYLEEVINRHLPKERHVSREEAYLSLAEKFLCSIDLHEAIPLIDGVIEVLPQIAQRYEVWTVTARQKVSMHVVKHVLDRHVPGCVTGIHCVWDRRDGAYHAITKREFISGFEGEKVAFFDDTPREVLEVQDVVPSYLFDPHGLYDGMQEIRARVRSWREIGQILLK